MTPLAALYHPGGSDPGAYPVTVVDFLTNWSEETGAVTQVVVVTTDGLIRTVDADGVQVVDRSVAAAIAAATEVAEKQRQQQGTVPPGR